MKTFVILLAALLSTGTLFAQAGRNAKEARQNTKARATNASQLERDTQELADFRAKLIELEAAFTAKDKLRLPHRNPTWPTWSVRSPKANAR